MLQEWYVKSQSTCEGPSTMASMGTPYFQCVRLDAFMCIVFIKQIPLGHLLVD